MRDWFKKRPQTCTDDDVRFLFLLCLGRDPLDDTEIRSRSNGSVFGLCKSLLASGQFRRNMLDPFFLDRKPARAPFGDAQQKRIRQGLEQHFDLAPDVHELTCWARSLRTALSSPRFVRALNAAGHPATHQWLLDKLTSITDGAPSTLLGRVDRLSSTNISGFVIDKADPEREITLDVFLNNDFAGNIMTGTQRRDIQEQHGGNGLSGFQLDIQVPPHLASLDKLVVHLFDHDSGYAICQGQEMPVIGARHEHHLSRLIGELGALRRENGSESGEIADCLNRIEAQLPEIKAYAALPMADYDIHARLFTPPAPPAPTGHTETVVALNPADIPGEADADIIPFVPVGESLAEHAEGHILAAAASNPDAVVFFADHDTMAPDGSLNDPVFKAAFDYDVLLANPAYASAYAIRREALADIGGFDAKAKTAQHQDLWLRLYERFGARAFHHVPHILWHKEANTPPPVLKDSMNVLKGHFARTGVKAMPRPHKDMWGGDAAHLLSVSWPMPETPPSLAVIIPTRDALDLTRNCVESLLKTLAFPKATEIVIMDNGSQDKDMLAWLKQIGEQPSVRVIRHDKPFNWSALNNLAVEKTDAEHLLFLNNDTCATEKGWDQILRCHLSRPDVGTLGARLFFEDGTLQFAGYILDSDRIALKEAYGESPQGGGYMNRSQLCHESSALIGAFLACTRETFHKLGGFDENFAVAFNDIDFTVRAEAAGYRNLYCPEISFYHFESKSRGYDAMDSGKKAREMEERTLLKAKHGEALKADRHYPAAVVSTEPTYSFLAQPTYFYHQTD